MLTTCVYCGQLHNFGEECPKKPKQDRRKEKDNYIRRFRSSYKWVKKAEEIKKRDCYMCQYSKAHGIIETHNLEVHHIVPIKKDWSKRLDNSNLITLTRTVHEKAEAGIITKEELLSIVPPG